MNNIAVVTPITFSITICVQLRGGRSGFYLLTRLLKCEEVLLWYKYGEIVSSGLIFFFFLSFPYSKKATQIRWSGSPFKLRRVWIKMFYTKVVWCRGGNSDIVCLVCVFKVIWRATQFIIVESYILFLYILFLR